MNYLILEVQRLWENVHLNDFLPITLTKITQVTTLSLSWTWSNSSFYYLLIDWEKKDFRVVFQLNTNLRKIINDEMRRGCWSLQLTPAGVTACHHQLSIFLKKNGGSLGVFLNPTRHLPQRPPISSQLVKRQHWQGPQEIKCVLMWCLTAPCSVSGFPPSLCFSLPLWACVCLCVAVEVKVDDMQ